jgi:hypothetical protein
MSEFPPLAGWPSQTGFVHPPEKAKKKTSRKNKRKRKK